MNRFAAVTAALVVSAGCAVGAAPSATAEPLDQAFLTALTGAGLAGLDPGRAIAAGQQVCTALVEPGQQAANVAAAVADAIGRPLGPATMFAGLAIQIFCPAAVSRLVDGDWAQVFPLIRA